MPVRGQLVAREQGCPNGKRGASDSRHTKSDWKVRKMASNRRLSDSGQIPRMPTGMSGQRATFLWP